MGGLLARLMGGNNNQGAEAKRPSRVSEQDKAILSLKQQRDKLHKYQKKINTQMAREKEVAKQLVKDGRKEKAKLLLKKKHYLESLLDKTDTQLDNLQQMVETIEFTQIEMQVVEGLKTGNQCLEEMHKIMSLEDVERIMDETQDAIEYQREIDELLGQNLTDEDEEAVARELEMILSDQLPSVPTTVGEGAGDIVQNLPEAPTHAIGLEEEPKKEKEKPKVLLA